jgi:hypothetical protein
VKLITANIPTHFVGLTKDAVSFFAKEYWSEKERNSVDEIKVVFLKFPRTSDVVAYTDHEIDPGYNPSLFIIEFNNTRYKDIKPNWYVRTIFHEMVHIGQIATGQLRTTSKAWYFKSTKYPDGTPYWKMPWEFPAYGIEVCAYKLFEERFPQYELKQFKVQYNGCEKSGWKPPKNKRLDPLKNQ